MTENISVIIPAKNEAGALAGLLARVKGVLPDAEIILVDDGSTDDTGEVARAAGATVVRHAYSKGNGAAVKSGIRAASGDILIMMDADGQHPPESIPGLLEKFRSGFDMVVGARTASGQASMGRWAANSLYNRLSSWMVGQTIEDLTSGFRVVSADKMREFIHLLPNGFSYPTTSTMAFFRAGYTVGYVTVEMPSREGKSHIRPLHDGIRFLLIIFKVGVLYSPLKLFFPISLLFFMGGVGYYGYTYLSDGRFTNMGALLFTTSLLVFLIGLVSEQITMLLYQRR